MRYWFLGALLLVGCNQAGYRAVSIRPTYGWQDGCTSVTIAGHGFGDEVSATIGGADFTDIVRPEDENDLQYFFYALTPPASQELKDAWAQLDLDGDGTPDGRTSGTGDVVVTSDGAESTITGTGAFFMLECPGAAYVEDVSTDTIEAADSVVSIAGCGIDASSMSVSVRDAAGDEVGTAALTSDCSTAYASFTAPNLPDGDYYFVIKDTSGVLFPSTGDPVECAAGGTESDVPDCEDAPALTYAAGGAR